MTWPPPADLPTLRAEVARCDAEIAACLREFYAGNPDIHGCVLGYRDWSDERKYLLELIAKLGG